MITHSAKWAWQVREEKKKAAISMTKLFEMDILRYLEEIGFSKFKVSKVGDLSW